MKKKIIKGDDTSFVHVSTTGLGASKNRWYLGIDIGSTGLSAVLLDYKKQRLHPISWHSGPVSYSGDGSLGQDSPPCFRLPTTVLFVPHTVGDGLNAIPEWGTLKQEMVPAEGMSGTRRVQIREVGQHKDILNIAIPHYSSQTQRWEPEIQQGCYSMMEHCSYPLPLSEFYQALKALLTTLVPSPAVTLPPFSSDFLDSTSKLLTLKVWGMDSAESYGILQHLTGVVVGYPASWSAAYRFNIREAILGARLVARASQIMMVNDAIATLLSLLPGADGTPITFPDILAQVPLHANATCSGVTLVINAGATTTELAIAHVSSKVAAFPSPTASSLPPAPELNVNNMVFRSLAYGGNAMDQDIISQLLYPRLAQANQEFFDRSLSVQPQSQSISSQTVPVSSWLQSLGVDRLDLPSAGEPDQYNRQALQQQLYQSPLGHRLLQQARSLKLALQHQAIASVTITNQPWQIGQDELGSRVLLPYVRRLHREVNALLDQVGVAPRDINYVVCSGGTASLRFMAVWLQKTFPNAQIAQDVFRGDPTLTLTHNVVPTCSRVAYGLASLPLHPRTINWAIHQPCEYDFLMELGRMLPNRALTLRDILGLLERQGINSEESRSCVLSLLEGKLPAGLIPQGIHANALTLKSKNYYLYQQLLSAPLFERVDAQTYHPNRHQWVLLQQYLTTLTAGTRQTLFQPQPGMAVS